MPIFLSIGYSTCHWCHVMERESFEDDEVAKMMNEAFICIKVDREERPDIDNIYMRVCQMMTGSGGWPLNIILTPDKKPFFAATYLPKQNRLGRIGMVELIHRIKELWNSKQGELEESAALIISSLREKTISLSDKELGEESLKMAYDQLSAVFDEEFGGFGNAPKFPTPHNLMFLLRYWKRYSDNRALYIAEKTLYAMRLGGIFDHLGFGFHRYSTDRRWFLPHFEKMLYDQALLAIAYIETYQVTGKDEYRETAHWIFEYVLREMTSPQGGFYSAQDADSEGEEGKFYLWSYQDILGVLGKEDADLVTKVFNLEQDGNYEGEAAGQKEGRNILFLRKPIPEIAADLHIPVEELKSRLEVIREKLFATREKRIHPQKDDKVLTDWNGLMIASFAIGTHIFDEPAYLEAAEKAANFILDEMRDQDGRLLHRYRDGEASIPAFLDDYAFIIWGLIELYQASFKADYLKVAVRLNNILLEHFWDGRSGGFFQTSNDTEAALIRNKEIYDGATPSGNSVAMLNLLRLSRLTGSAELEGKASQISRAFFNKVRDLPSAYSYLMSALDYGIGPSYEIVVAGNSKTDDTRKMLKAIKREFIPNKVLLFKPIDAELEEITQIAEFTRNMSGIQGKATAYICRNYNCMLPTVDLKKVLEFFKQNKG